MLDIVFWISLFEHSFTLGTDFITFVMEIRRFHQTHLCFQNLKLLLCDILITNLRKLMFLIILCFLHEIFDFIKAVFIRTAVSAFFLAGVFCHHNIPIFFKFIAICAIRNRIVYVGN